MDRRIALRKCFAARPRNDSLFDEDLGVRIAPHGSKVGKNSKNLREKVVKIGIVSDPKQVKWLRFGSLSMLCDKNALLLR